MSSLAPIVSSEAAAHAVEAFIVAMNEWEIASWERMRQFHGTERSDEHWAEAARTLTLLQGTHLTPRRRVYAEQPSFGHPPAYDIKREAVTASSIEGKKAVVETARTGALSAGQYKYVLRFQESRWLIDSVKKLANGQWKTHIL